jgi:hypothetical protein
MLLGIKEWIKLLSQKTVFKMFTLLSIIFMKAYLHFKNWYHILDNDLYFKKVIVTPPVVLFFTQKPILQNVMKCFSRNVLRYLLPAQKFLTHWVFKSLCPSIVQSTNTGMSSEDYHRIKFGPCDLHIIKFLFWLVLKGLSY